MMWTKKDMNKSNNDFKCDMCEFSCKKRNMLNKHMNSKHNDHICKTCHKVFPNSMDALMYTAKDHSDNIIEDTPKINSVIVKDKDICEYKEHMDKSKKFKCAECKEIVSHNDKFNENLKENQMCKLCTMTAEYGE